MPSPSLAAWLAVESAPERETEAESVFAGYLLDQRPLAEGPHLGLIAVVGVLLWGSLPSAVLLGWLGSVAAATLLCALLIRRLATTGAPPRSVLTALRVGAALVGWAWGFGAGLSIPMLPQLEQLFVVVALVGLLSGSAMSLLADPVSYAALLGAVVAGGAAPLAFSDIPAVTAMIMTGSAGAVGLVGILFRRAHGLLRRYLEAAQRLEGVNDAVVRERRILEAILTHAPSAIAIIDGAGRVLAVNPGFDRLFGYRNDAVVGQTLAYLFDLPAREVPELTELGGPVETVRRMQGGGERPVLLAAGVRWRQARNMVFGRILLLPAGTAV